MRVRITLILLLFCFASAARAQNLQLFGGYSFLGNTGTSYEHTDVNGWNASVTANYKSWGLVADFSGHPFSTGTIAPVVVTGSGGSGTMFLFGPQYSFRRVPRVTPFVHALFGAVQGSSISSVVTPEVDCPVPGPCPSPSATIAPETVFAMALGGGLDVKVRNHVWVRLFQADYVRQNFSQNPGYTGAINTARISAGIVFTLGKR